MKSENKSKHDGYDRRKRARRQRDAAASDKRFRYAGGGHRAHPSARLRKPWASNLLVISDIFGNTVRTSSTPEIARSNSIKLAVVATRCCSTAARRAVSASR